jgi:hypothetical protein
VPFVEIDSIAADTDIIARGSRASTPQEPAPDVRA